MTALAGWPVWSSPLVLKLHVVASGLASLAVLPPVTGFCLLGIGAFGGMTLSVMMRAAFGHTGRAFLAGPTVMLAFACVAFAAVARVTAPVVLGLCVAAALWTAGLVIFVWRFTRVLSSPNPARRQPNRCKRVAFDRHQAST